MKVRKSPIGISIIILSFNTNKITDKCLTAVKKSLDYLKRINKVSCQVIVIDNASTDGSVRMIRKKHKWVKLITSKVNLGFAKGNNLGMTTAKGNYILLLNSDAFLEKDTLSRAYIYMQKHSECDVLGPSLTYEDGSFQPSAGYLPNPLNIFSWMLMLDKLPFLGNLLDPYHPNNKHFFKKDRKVGWVTGAFMFMKREVYETTGGFDEIFFMYTEEVEWCKRIKDANFSIQFTPNIKIIHQKFASSNFNQAAPIIYETYGILYFFKKHYPNSIWRLKLALYLGYNIRVILFLLLNNSQKVNAYASMLREGIWKKLE